jgi:hypothetical protein
MPTATQKSTKPYPISHNAHPEWSTTRQTLHLAAIKETTMTDPTPTPNPTPTQDPAPTPRFRDTYQHHLDEIKQVPDSDLIAINIDIPTAVNS